MQQQLALQFTITLTEDNRETSNIYIIYNV